MRDSHPQICGKLGCRMVQPVIAIVFCGCYVRLAIGRWPRVYRDSPDVLLVDAAAVVTMLAAISWPATACLALLLPIVRVAFRAPVLSAQQFLDKPDPFVATLERELGSSSKVWVPVRLVSHHMRLLGVLDRPGGTDRLVLVDNDDEKS